MDMQTPSCCLHAANKLSQFIQSCPASIFVPFIDLPMGLAGAVLCWEPVQEALPLHCIGSFECILNDSCGSEELHAPVAGLPVVLGSW